MRCSTFRARWADVEGRAMELQTQAAMTAHIQSCPRCQASTDRYAESVSSFEEATQAVGSPEKMPSFERIQGAMREGRRNQDTARERVGWALWWAAPVAVAVALLVWFVPAGSELGPLEVFRANGVVGYSESGDWTPLVQDVRVGTGGVVETGHQAGVSLGKEGVGRIRVGPDSRVKLEQWSADQVTVELFEGSVGWTPVPGLDVPVGSVRTPLAWINGVEFSASHKTQSGTTVEALRGPVTVSDLSGAKLGEVAAGGRFHVGHPDPPKSNKPPETVSSASPNGSAPQGSKGAPEGSKPQQDLSESKPQQDLALTTPTSTKPAPIPTRTAVATKLRPKTGSIAASKAKRSARRDVADSTKAPVVTAPKVQPPTPATPPDAPKTEPDPPSATAPEPTPEAPSIDALVKTASKLMATGKDQQAVRVLSAASKRSPSYRVLRALGDAHALAGSQAAAAEAYRRALSKAGARDAGALVVDLATAYRKQGQATAATEVLLAYVSNRPKGSANGEARWRLSKWQPNDAETHWRGILDHAPGSAYAPLALDRLGRRLLQRGSSTAAMKLFKRFRTSSRRRLAEIALVGTMHVHHRAGARAKLDSAYRTYQQRFPKGKRRGEVARLIKQR